MTGPEQSYELDPDASHTYGLPSWPRANPTARAAALEGVPALPPAQPGQPRARAAAARPAARAAQQGAAAQDLLAAPLLGHGPPDLPRQALVVAALGGQAGLDLAALLDQAAHRRSWRAAWAASLAASASTWRRSRSSLATAARSAPTTRS
jgi:hypothetical protein